MSTRDKQFELIWQMAELKGKEAAKAAQVQPMVVEQHSNPLNDNSPVTKAWLVPDGVCGFAYLTFKPGNHPFCNWLKKKFGRHVYKAYYGGLEYSIHEYGQSMQRKMAHAGAMARVLHDELKDPKLHIWAHDRMD